MTLSLLLAALTALFMGVGYLLGGSSGMVVAFLVAAAGLRLRSSISIEYSRSWSLIRCELIARRCGGPP